jgi:hypothetical protein
VLVNGSEAHEENILQGQIQGLEALVAALGGADNRRVTDQGVVDSGVRDQVRLELVQIDVQGSIESQRARNRADNLRNQTVEVLERGAGDVKVATADVVDGFIVNKERAVRVLDGAVGGEDCVVGFDDGSGDQGSRVDGKLELGLLAVVGAQALKEERAESGTSSTTEGVEDEEALETGAVVLYTSQSLAHLSRSPFTRQDDRSKELRFTHQDTSDLVQSTIQDLLSDGVVTTRIVVGRVLLAADQQLRVEQLSVITSADLIDGTGVQVDEDRSGDVFARTGFGEDGIELAAVVESLGIRVGTAILLEAVLEEVAVE